MVDVYRNLHLNQYSIQFKGKVIGHSSVLSLKKVQFIVQPSGRNRVLKEGRKNVHAFVRGELIKTKNKHRNLIKVTYNPYLYSSFIECSSRRAIVGSDLVYLDKNGVWAQGIQYEKEE